MDKTEPQPCHTCIHYNHGHGDIDCYFCEPEFGEDRWSDKEYADENDGINKID